MIQYFLVFCILCVFISSYYLHFFARTVEQSDLMIAYIGNEHPRLFEQQFTQERADLIVFRNRPFRSKRLQFAPPGSELNKFTLTPRYRHLLVLYNLQPQVPMFYDTRNNIEYIHNNETVAELWHKPIKLHKLTIYL
jgi:hypothetical protein